MIVLDASVLIAFLERQDGHHARAEALLLAEADEDLAASVVTIGEVLVLPVRSGVAETVQRALQDLGITALELPASAPLELARLRATTSLKMPDCCVLLAAEQHVARVATFDERLREAATDRGVDTVDA